MASSMYMPRLKSDFRERVVPALREELGYVNDMQVPRLEKVVLNMGVGKATQDSKKVRSAQRDMTLIAGQHAVITNAKLSVASFRLREGQAIGSKVTLRKDVMYDFVDRLVNVALPRIRDFAGLKANSFDGRGNFALGIKEHIVFQEIDYDSVEQIWGMDIVVCTTARSDSEGKALLEQLNFPFRK